MFLKPARKVHEDSLSLDSEAEAQESRLRTKIVATIGPTSGDRYDPELKQHTQVSYEDLFNWFTQRGYPDCLMVDVIRLNMAFFEKSNGGQSYRNTEVYEAIFNWFEQEKDGLAKNLCILCDLAGAKIRLGKINSGKIALERGHGFQLLLSTAIEGNANQASLQAHGASLLSGKDGGKIRKRLIFGLSGSPRGIEVSIGDGKITLRTTGDVRKDNSLGYILDCKVEKEGEIESGKGVTFEGIDLGLPSFDDYDKEALKYILDLDNKRGFVAFVGVSFARTAEDILNVRTFINDYYTCKSGLSVQSTDIPCPDIIAKIETGEGVKRIKQILDVADGAMIARGDLALQVGREEVPEIQKYIITLCNQRGKIAITATQMLISMENNPKPTRAEVNDVFNAVLDGTDAVMLSDETATGKYPSQAVEYMARIAGRAEEHFSMCYPRGSIKNARRLQELRRGSGRLIQETNGRISRLISKYGKPEQSFERGLLNEKLRKSEDQGTTDLICEAGCHLAEEEQIKAIAVSSGSGRTVRMVSRFRPSLDIIGIARDERVRRKMLLSYGVYPLNIGEKSPEGKRWDNTDQIYEAAAKRIPTELLANESDTVVFIGGNPLGEYGKVNVLHIKELPKA